VEVVEAVDAEEQKVREDTRHALQANEVEEAEMVVVVVLPSAFDCYWAKSEEKRFRRVANRFAVHRLRG
jgi:hypothetical protein